MDELLDDISEQILEIRISLVLLSEGRAMMAKEIAAALNLSKKEINSFLYQHTDSYRKDEKHYWSRIPAQNGVASVSSDDGEDEAWEDDEPLFDDPVLRKLCNQNGAERFDPEDFKALADWSYGASKGNDTVKGVHETRTGNRIEYDSDSERKMLEYLDECEFVEEIGGQCLCIPYATPFKSDKQYYPDIVIYTTDGYIAIIEVKDATAMSYHGNLEKYDALENYCLENGYLYMMVDSDPKKDWLTVEELVDIPVDEELLNVFAELEEQAKASPNCVLFSNEDVNEWYESFGKPNGYKKRDFQLQVHSMVIWEDWYNKYKRNGFMVYSEPTQ